MNKILILINFFLFIVVIVFINNYLKNYAYPNTYLSRINLSGKSRSEIKKIINPVLFSNETISLKVKNRIYKIRNGDVGIFLDEFSTINLVFENNNKSFPGNIKAFIQARSFQRYLFPTILVSQEFYDFTENTTFDFSQKENDVIVDNQNKSIDFKNYEEKYKIDPEDLKKQIIFNFGKNSLTIEPLINKIDEDAIKKKAIVEYNERLDRTFNQPIDIIVNNDLSQKISIPLTDLKKIINVDYDKKLDKVNFSIENNSFSSLVLSKFTPYTSDDKKVDINILKNNLLSLVTSRFNGIKSNIVVAKVDLGPNTSGEAATKYIEIDLSQQNMYLFENKKLVDNHKISSGLYYPTPTGQFKILNKALNAYSNIYHVWMPFWMAFYYDSKLKASFGIHELPYWISDQGQRIQRPRDFIGSPNTGGCVSLDIGAANEVYNFAEVNMPVYIFN